MRRERRPAAGGAAERAQRASALWAASADLLLAVGQKARAALARLNLGDLARDQGDLEEAWTIYQECLASFREAGDTWSTAQALHGLGLVASEQGDQQRA